MNPQRLLLPWCLLSFGAQLGCVDETDPLSETAQDVTKSDIETAGGVCLKNPFGPKTICTQCWSYGGGEICINYECDGDQCTPSKVYIDANTYDADLNYWFEAEATKIDGSIQFPADANASAGKYLYVAGSGSTRTTFEAPVAGTVYGWVRVIAPSTSANSVYLQVDATTAVRVELPVSTAWTWVPIDASWYLATGTHTLRFYADELGVKIDRVLLTGNPDFVPVVRTTDAEAPVALVAPMQRGTQRTIPPVGYVWVPNGAGTNGLAQLDVSVPYTGHYAVWGRFNAPTDADNAFSIGQVGQPRTAWNVPLTSAGGWAWSRAPLTYAPDADEVLELVQREDGTKLDKLFVTNDPGFSLVEVAAPVNTL